MRIAVADDNIVEGNEMFSMRLKVPSLPGIIAGSLTSAIGIIFDTTGM